jgi:DNA-binding NtrC family response regulator
MRVLVIGENNTGFKQAVKLASDKGAKVSLVEDPSKALDNLRSGKGADLILIDVKLDIKSFVESLNSEKISVPIIACGFENDIKLAVNAIKYGAQEYLPLPPSEDLIAAILENISNQGNNIICGSKAMERPLEIARKVSSSDANILITGESGTGKEIFANYIHENSERAKNPFIRVNCAAIPKDLLESELFGHEKGAFTGAVARRIGKFEESSGGTLLLDEISEIDISLQAKLLRAIQEEEIDRLGGNKPVKLDLRIIATTNRDLMEEIKKGNFREDLYYRLNIIELALPPIRERKEDIEEFANYFIDKYCKNNRLPPKKLSGEALNILKQHNWPGNVRELENSMHRAVLLSEETIKPKDLQIQILSENSNVEALNKTDDSAEKQYIANALKHCLGDQNHVANILGISINLLKEKIEHYCLQDKIKEYEKEV